MKLLLVFLFLLCSAPLCADSCKDKLRSVFTTTENKVAAYLTHLIEKNIFNQQSIQRLIGNSMPLVSDLRFTEAVTESQKISIVSALEKIFSTPVAKSNWTQIGALLKNKIVQKQENEKTVGVVSEKTKNLPSFEKIFESTNYFEVREEKEYGKKKFMRLTRKGIKRNAEFVTDIFDFDLKKIREESREDSGIPEFTAYTIKKTVVEGESIYLYKNSINKRGVLVFKDKEYFVSNAKVEGTIGLYEGMAGKFAIYDGQENGLWIKPIGTIRDIKQNNVQKQPYSSVSHISKFLSGTERNLYLIEFINIGLAEELKVTDALSGKIVANFKVDFQMANNASVLGSSHNLIGEVLYKGEPYAVLTTNLGIKLLNLKNWNVLTLGKADFRDHFVDIKKIDKNHLYTLSLRNGEPVKIIKVYDFTSSLQPTKEITLHGQLNIHSNPILKHKNKVYFVNLEDRRFLNVIDVLEGVNVLSKRLDNQYVHEPVIRTITNAKGEVFVVLSGSPASNDIIQVYEIKDL